MPPTSDQLDPKLKLGPEATSAKSLRRLSQDIYKHGNKGKQGHVTLAIGTEA